MRRLGLLALLAACGSGTTLTAASFPLAFAQAVCEVQSRCRQEAHFLEQQCESDSSALYAGDLAKALAAGKSSFDAAQAQSCLDALRARGCGRTPPEVDQACERAVTGRVATGQACSWIYECAVGRCEPQSGTCPATCGTVAAEGQSCAETPCDLRAGLRCVENVCVRPHTAGLSCGSSADCTAGLYCDGLLQCATPGFELAACTSDDQCAAGLFCDVASAVSGACRKRAAQGQACSAASLDSVRFACGDGMVCRGFSFAKGGSTPGTCAATGEIGAPCTAGADVAGCGDGLVCANGACADKPASGPCAAQEDCKDGVAYCDGAQCHLLKEDGAPCTSSVECENRLCDGGICTHPPGACHEP